MSPAEPNLIQEVENPSSPNPYSVWLALGLLAFVTICKLVGAIQTTLMLGDIIQELERANLGNVKYSIIAGIVVDAAPPLMLGLGVILRRNWARIGWLIYTLLCVAALIYNQSNSNQPFAQAIQANVALVAQILAVYLLFTGDGRRWFDRRAIRP